MFNTAVKKIFKNSGYDCNYAISEDHILSLMQAAYNAGKNGELIVNCPCCNGTGYIRKSATDKKTCHACSGNKTVLITGQ